MTRRRLLPCVLVALAWLAPSGVAQQPVADFTASPTSGPAVLDVDFTNLSTSGLLFGAAWDFGDGTASTQWSPTHAYGSPGTYTVELTVTNFATFQSDTVVMTDLVTVDPAPYVVAISADPTSGTNPLTVDFRDETTGALNDGWAWDFGDGGGSTQKNPTHVYTAPGAYTVSLTATSGVQGGTATVVDLVTVLPSPVVPDFTSAPDPGGTPQTLVFTPSATGGTLTAWHWDFGDGGTSTDESPTHTYVWPGKYPVTLTGFVGQQPVPVTQVVQVKPPFAAGTVLFDANPLGLEAADVDGDGDTDLVTFEYGPRMRWYPNDAGYADPPTAVTIRDPAFGTHRDLAVADMDGDGDVDVVAAWFGPATPGITWHVNLAGDGVSWGVRIVETDAVKLANDIEPVDLDGDGDVDLVVGYNSQDGALVRFENLDGDGDFGSPVPIALPGTSARHVHAADLDDDGDPDLAVSMWLEDLFVWCPNQGDGSFGPAQVVESTLPNPHFSTSADMDGDGDLDLVMSTSNSQARWYPNDGAGGFGPVQVIGSQAQFSDIHALDLDADGDPDLVGEPLGLLAWWENTDGLGTLAPPVDLMDGPASVYDTVFADLDGDGDVDIAVSDTWTSDLRILENFIQWDHLGGASPGAAGAPRLLGAGALAPGSPLRLDLDGAPAGAPFLLWLAFTSTPSDVLGGTLHAFPRSSQLLVPTDAAGAWTQSLPWPNLPSGVDFWLQAIVQDGSVPAGLTLSNGLRAQSH